jgi:hypothetical protein
MVRKVHHFKKAILPFLLLLLLHLFPILFGVGVTLLYPTPPLPSYPKPSSFYIPKKVENL